MINHGDFSRWRSPRTLPVRLTLIGIALIALPALFISPRPSGESYCGICGARQSETSWAVRGTNATLLHTHQIKSTPLSELLTSRHLAASHNHQWLAPRAVPNPLNEFGPPVVESLEFINTPRVLNFMRDLVDFADPQSITNWRKTVMSPEFSYALDPALRFYRAPAEGFGERQKFLAWWQASAFPLYQHLREETEPD